MAQLKDEVTNSPPARSAAARERQLIGMAMDLAEKQLKKGTATSQVITHFLKLATEQDELSREKTRNEIKLLKTKVESLESSQRIEELYINAMEAMKVYSGESDASLDDQNYEDR